MQHKLQQKLGGIKTSINELLLKTVEIEEEIKSIKDDNLNAEAWIPKEGDFYVYIDNEGNIGDSHYDSQWGADVWNVMSGNYFKTAQEFVCHKANIITKEKLKRLALRLNNGVAIDWENPRICKPHIYFDFFDNKLHQMNNFEVLNGSIHCLSPDFLKIAIQEIGEQELINYIKSGV